MGVGLALAVHWLGWRTAVHEGRRIWGVAFDTLAIPLNIVAKTNVPFLLDVLEHVTDEQQVIEEIWRIREEIAAENGYDVDRLFDAPDLSGPALRGARFSPDGRLVEIAELGLVYTTTVGMEMAMSGVPVIVSGMPNLVRE